MAKKAKKNLKKILVLHELQRKEKND